MHWFVSRYHRQLHFQSDLPEVIKSFANCPDISIDISVMEKTNNGIVLPLDAGWSDIGSWQALWETSEQDANGNFIQGRVLTESTNNCYLSS